MNTTLAAATPIYPHEKLEYGATLEVAPGIHWVRMPLPFALNHINLWLMEDEGGFTIIDTGYNTEDTRGHWRAALARIVDGRAINRVIVTHFHPDHLGLAGWFAETYGAELWMPYAEWLQGRIAFDTEDTDKWVGFYVANGLSDKRAAAYRRSRGTFRIASTPIPETLRRIYEGNLLEIGGRLWRVITGAGHSPEHACLYSDELKILISGDQVLPRISTNVSVWYTEPHGNPLRQFIDSFAKFRGLPGRCFVLPSHDRPFFGLNERLDALTQHHDTRLDRALTACREPATAVAVVPALFDRVLDDQQIGFAIGECLAHLNYLVAAKQLERLTDKDGKIRFRAI